MISWIRALYAIERSSREGNLPPEQRKKLRVSLSLPILKNIAGWLVEMEINPVFLPKDPLGKAHTYLRNRFDYLLRYLEEGRLEIDNNLAENLIRPIAVGRKNYLFAGSHQAKRAAMIYSLQHPANSTQ
ncbi:MAG: transposase [Bacteroidia bacterium]|nr:transposase [Bacteroidia bacterium]